MSASGLCLETVSLGPFKVQNTGLAVQVQETSA